MINEKEKFTEKKKFVNLTERDLGDDQIILDSFHLLSTLNAYQIEDYKTPENWLLICENKLKLEQLLLEKVKLITDRDCLKLIQEGIKVIRQLESIFGEDSYKLEIATAIVGVKDEERKMSIDNFKNTIKNRKQLSENIEKKLKSWILSLNNINHFFYMTKSIPKPNLIKFIIEQTIKEFERIKISIAYWMSLILYTNLKIIVYYWDQLNSDCLSSICMACTRFNLLFPKNSINVIKVIAENQAITVSSKISFLLQSELKKVITTKQQTKFFHEVQDNTSDYFTESTLSDQFKDYFPSNFIDFQSYLQIVINNSQRVILKLAFSVLDHSPKNTKNSTQSGSRQTWFKLDQNLILPQQKTFHYCDSLYWPIFWKSFKSSLIFELVLLKPGLIATPMILCPENYQTLLTACFKDTFKNLEFPIEAKNEIVELYYECFYHLTAHQWLKTFSKINLFQDNLSLSVFNKDFSKIFDKQTLQTLNFLVIFILESSKKIGDYKKQLAIQLLKALLNQLINFMSTLNESKSLDLLVYFFKDIQIISQNLNLLTSHEKLNELMDHLLNLIGLSIERAIYLKTLDCFMEKIIKLKISKGSNIKKDFCSYNLIKKILESSFENLAKVSNVQKVKSLKQNMIEIFCKVFVDISKSSHMSAKIKLSKIGKNVLKEEISKTVVWVESNLSETCTVKSFLILKQYLNNFKKSNSKNCFPLCNNKINPQDYDHNTLKMKGINKVFYSCLICITFLK